MQCNNEIGMTVRNNKRNQQLEKGEGREKCVDHHRAHMEGGARVECRIITRTHTVDTFSGPLPPRLVSLPAVGCLHMSCNIRCNIIIIIIMIIIPVFVVVVFIQCNAMMQLHRL